MIRKVEESCSKLLSHDKVYLVALSGGADSVALLRLLLSLEYKVEAVHCNFHLRGAEADRDEQFCKDLCQCLNVPLHLVHFDTKTYAELHGVSIEMAARTLRYNHFEKLISDLGFEGVCVAHHKDDSVETVLLNLVRGTGIEGLCGISPRNGNVIRPLLGISRSEIIDYLRIIKQGFVTDSSNLHDDVQRNKVRLNVIPELKDVNPAAVENINKLSLRVQDTLLILNDAISKGIRRISDANQDGDIIIDLPRLIGEPGSETLLWHLLKDKGFSSLQVEQIYTCLSINTERTGSRWESVSHILLVDRERLIVHKKESSLTREMKVPEGGIYIYDESRKFRITKSPVDKNFVVSRIPNKVCLDADKVRFPLTIRTVRTGDWFVPFGMKGRKLVSDFLTDRKFSLLEKRQQLAIADADGNLVWLVGLRPDNRFCVTDETKTSIVLEICESK